MAAQISNPWKKMRDGRVVAMNLMALFAGVVLSAAPVLASDHFDFRTYEKKPASWFRSAEGSNVVANVLENQAGNGGWPKNIDTAEKQTKKPESHSEGTFDNGATTGEIRLMALAFNATGNARCRDAAVRGIDLILKAQYPNGGWPQYFPPPEKAYNRYITFNDDAMVRLLELLREVATSNRFAFVDASHREAAQRAFDRGIKCILKCQITVNGRLTVWCQQHDDETLEPRPARKFELVGLTGGESAGILLLLMSIEKPSPDIIRAVRAGARWYEANKITGLKEVVENGDKKMVKDAGAPPLWARYYDIETGRPFFSDRDSVKKFDIAEIGPERRNGYSWYGTWGEKVAKRYDEWKAGFPPE
jgi:pectate lyase